MKRKNIRLKEYDYTRNGAYFITICTKDKKKILGWMGDVPKNVLSQYGNVGDGAHDVPKINLSQYGKIVDKYIKSSKKIKGIKIDKYVIMPNHIHLIIMINNNGTSRAPSQYNEIKDFVSMLFTLRQRRLLKKNITNSLIAHTISTFKRLVNKEVGMDIFQRSYYDHIIRNQHDYEQIWKYIDNNLLK